MTTSTSSRRATAADVARAVGVSRATVGYVLNGTPGQKISDATTKKVLDVARELGYRPHAAAQVLASGRSRIVLLVLPDWPLDHSVRRYIEEASLVLDESGYTLVTWSPHETGKTRPLWEQLDPDVVVGFSPFPDEDVQAMRAHGISHIIPEPHDTTERAVGGGPALQVRHLHELGHRRIALATTADSRLLNFAHERVEAARDAARRFDMVCVDVGQVDTPDAERTQLVARWLDMGATGVVAYNDDVAATVVRAALEGGFSVPHDLSVIGHDDSPIASLFMPALSSVRLDNAGLGRLVARMALAKMGQGEDEPAEHASYETIVARESTAEPQHRRRHLRPDDDDRRDRLGSPL
jgi:DNA-binding LacI/PurR family transcriptional regulator